MCRIMVFWAIGDLGHYFTYFGGLGIQAPVEKKCTALLQTRRQVCIRALGAYRPGEESLILGLGVRGLGV